MKIQSRSRRWTKGATDVGRVQSGQSQIFPEVVHHDRPQRAARVSYAIVSETGSKRLIKRLLASLAHGLLWLTLAYVIWGFVVRHRYADAWKATTAGESVPTVVNRFGAPDYLQVSIRSRRID